MAACDFCYDEIMKFCHMNETKEGRILQQELVEMFSLEGFFPCDHQSYSEWADWYNHWTDDMLRYNRKNKENE